MSDAIDWTLYAQLSDVVYDRGKATSLYSNGGGLWHVCPLACRDGRDSLWC